MKNFRVDAKITKSFNETSSFINYLSIIESLEQKKEEIKKLKPENSVVSVNITEIKLKSKK